MKKESNEQIVRRLVMSTPSLKLTCLDGYIKLEGPVGVYETEYKCKFNNNIPIYRERAFGRVIMASMRSYFTGVLPVPPPIIDTDE